MSHSQSSSHDSSESWWRAEEGVVEKEKRSGRGLFREVKIGEGGVGGEGVEGESSSSDESSGLLESSRAEADRRRRMKKRRKSDPWGAELQSSDLEVSQSQI